MRGRLLARVIAAGGLCLAHQARAQIALFNFDAPGLIAGQGLPLLLASEGVTALFSSPGGSVFSLQSDSTTGYRLSRFSGLYLWPNSTETNVLDIQFNQALATITLVFATTDFQQVEVPTTVRLTAYQSSVGGFVVGSTTAHGTYAGDTMPMGTLGFASATPFNAVRLEIPTQPNAAVGFLVDSVEVTTTATPQVRRIRKHLVRAAP